MCWRCGVVSRNEVCVFFHREINNSPGMSGLPASGEGLVLASWGLPAAVMSGHGALSEPACWGRGHRRLRAPLVLVAFPCGQEAGALPALPVLSPGAEPAFPPGGDFPASPSKGLSKGLALGKLGHAWRASLLCLGAGGAEPALQLRALLGTSGQPRERKAPRRPGPPLPLQYQTPLNPLQGSSKG